MPTHGLSDIMLCPGDNMDTPEQAKHSLIFQQGRWTLNRAVPPPQKHLFKANGNICTVE